MLNSKKTGLALGSLAALLHLLWSLLIALGVGQSWIDWVMKIHMVKDTHTLLPFSLASAVTLIIVAFVIGNAVGYLFAHIWNKIQEK
ncbi:MAG: hypothetical protein AAB664_01610 [Patescibacteria group bacterium]